jgi:hypothetical protein
MISSAFFLQFSLRIPPTKIPCISQARLTFAEKAKTWYSLEAALWKAEKEATPLSLNSSKSSAFMMGLPLPFVYAHEGATKLINLEKNTRLL